MQCSKGGTDDPVATPTPKTQNCASGQIPQADGTCKAPDGTINCPIGQSQNASGQCVAITCTSVQTLNASGQCVAKTCLTAQTLNASNGMCEAITCPSGQSLQDGICKFTLVQCNVGINGPTKFILKYLDKTNPSPTSINSGNASMGIVMAKGCMETNTAVEYQAAQNILNQTSFIELQDGNTGMKIASLNFTNNSLDSNFIFPSTINATIITFKLQKSDSSNTIDGFNRIFSSTFMVLNVLQIPLVSCFTTNCFVKIENNVFIRSNVNINSFPSYFSNFTPSDFNDPTKFDPSIKAEVNRMYTNFANTPGVTWSTIPTWRTVLIP